MAYTSVSPRKCLSEGVEGARWVSDLVVCFCPSHSSPRPLRCRQACSMVRVGVGGWEYSCASAWICMCVCGSEWVSACGYFHACPYPLAGTMWVEVCRACLHSSTRGNVGGGLKSLSPQLLHQSDVELRLPRPLRPFPPGTFKGLSVSKNKHYEKKDKKWLGILTQTSLRKSEAWSFHLDGRWRVLLWGDQLIYAFAMYLLFTDFKPAGSASVLNVFGPWIHL